MNRSIIPAALLSAAVLTTVSQFPLRADSLALNTVVTGEISLFGQRPSYTFSGTTGQRLYYDALDSDGDAITVQLISPAGTVVGINQNSDFDAGPITLAETGTYSLVFDGSGAQLGDFVFRLLDIATQSELLVNTTVSQTLVRGNSTDLYRLAGAAGQRLYLDSLAANGGGSWALIGPDNVTLTLANLSGDMEATLGPAGTYLVAVLGNSPNPVPYSIRVETPKSVTNNLSLDATVVGAIATPGDQQVYQFVGAAGQRIHFDSLHDGVEPVNVRLYSPSGAPLFLNQTLNADGGPYTLPTAGVYSLVVDGAGATTAQYQFRVQNVSAAPALALDTTINRTLTPGNSADWFALNGVAGQALYFDGLSAVTGVNWFLYGPGNESVGSAGIGGDFEVTLPRTGQYLLGVVGNAKVPVQYAIQVVTPAATTNAPGLGATVTGALTEPGQKAAFTFAGAAGQRLYYDALDRDFEDVTVRLLSPNGAEFWVSNQSADVGPFTLGATGTYTLLIDGSGATVGDYSFRMLDLATATPLTVGSTVAGSLNPRSRTDVYRFQGTKGQRIGFDSISATAPDATWKLVNGADQVLVAGQITADLPTVPVTDDGPLLLLVEGSTENVAALNYQVKLLDLSDGPVVPSGFDVVISGSLPSNGAVTNQFTARAGTRLYIDSQDRTAGGITFELRDPSNLSLLLASGVNDFMPAPLSVSGVYSFIVRGTGTYRYRLLDMDTNSQFLALGSDVQGDLDAPAKSVIYRFKGVAGQRLFYDALDNDSDGISVRLLQPNGTVRYGGNSDFDVAPITLPSTGTHYLFVESQVTGTVDYRFRLLDVAAATALTFNTPVNGGLNPGTGATLYRFTGVAGQSLYFDALAANSGATWSLYQPDNNILQAPGLGQDFEQTLTASGEWVLAIMGNSPTAVNFSFQVNNTPVPTTPVVVGTTVSGALASAGDRANHTFQGTAGQRVMYDALEGDFEGISVRITSPSGGSAVLNQNADSDSGPITLTESGTYTIQLDGNGAVASHYSFRIIDLTPVPLLTFGATVNKTQTMGFAADWYRFTGVAGQHVYLDSFTPGGGGFWSVFGPGNELFGNTTINGDLELTLTQSGEYLVGITGNSASPLTFSFQPNVVQSKTNALTLNTTVTGVLAGAGDQWSYSFQGTAGQRLFYDALDSDFDQIAVRLTGPSGITVLLNQNSDSDSGPFTLVESGSYTLSMDGVGATVGDFSFRLWDLGVAPALALNTVVSKTLTPGLSSEWYSLNGVAGQTLYFDSQGANTAGVWTLFGPANEVIGSAGISGDFEVTLPRAGKYFLGIAGNGTAPLPFTVRVVTNQVTTTPLSFGAIVSGALDEPGERDRFTFQGAPGQRLYYDALDRDQESIVARLVGPTGTTLFEINHSGDFGPIVLPVAGTYTLVLDGNQSVVGDYSFRMLDLAAAVPMTLGTPLNGSLNPRSRTDVFRFDGTKGHRISFDSISATSPEATWRLVDPANVNLASGSILSDLASALLPETGTYVLLVEGQAENVAPLNYQVRLTDAGDPAVAASGFNAVVSGSLNGGQSSTNHFTAPAGLRIYFDTLDRTAFGVSFELYDSSNGFVTSFGAGSDDGPILLPKSGTYSLIAKGSGAFKYRLLNLEVDATPLTLGGTAQGNLDPGYLTSVYRLTLPAGRRIYYDALDADFDQVTARLYAPDGNYRFNINSDSDSGLVTAILPGTYYLFVENLLPGAANYAFRLLDATGAPEIQTGVAMNAALNPGTGAALYRLNGAKGAYLYFDASPANAGGSWVLYNPNNDVLAGPGFASDFELPLPMDGEYVLALVGNSATPTTPTFQVVDSNGTGGGGPVPAITAIDFDAVGGTATVEWTSAVGRSYTLQYTASLAVPAWVDLPGNVIATGTTSSKPDSMQSVGQRFYRVKLNP